MTKLVDVTDKMNKLITRRNSIWVLDWYHDLGVRLKQAWLNLKIEVNGQDLVSSRIYIVEKSEYLVNGFELSGELETMKVNGQVESISHASLMSIEKIHYVQHENRPLLDLPTGSTDAPLAEEAIDQPALAASSIVAVR